MPSNLDAVYQEAQRLSQKWFVDGKLMARADSNPIPSVNPATGEVIAQLASCDATCLENAISVARDAQKKWAKVAAPERGYLLFECAKVIATHAQELALLLSLETGKALSTESLGEIDALQGVFRFYGGLGSQLKGETLSHSPDMLAYTVCEPVGIVGAILPWNVPRFSSWHLRSFQRWLQAMPYW